MPNQHKGKPVAFRPAADVRDWLRAFAATTGRKVNEIINEALREYREAHENDDKEQDR